MTEFSITINARTYRLSCGDGEEERLRELAEHVKARVETLAGEVGNVGEERLLLMTAILLTDELWDLRAKARQEPPATHRDTESGEAS